jgi:hypothetical protein
VPARTALAAERSLVPLRQPRLTMTPGAYEGLIASCHAAADAADHCLSACLLEPDVAEKTRCIALCLESAQICRLLAGFAVRGSTFTPSLARPCLELCDAGAEECERHGEPHAQACATACRGAAEACRRMLAVHDS